MTLAQIAKWCSPEHFLHANLDALRLGGVTRRTVLSSSAEGTLIRRRDSTPLLVWNDHILGQPLPRSEVQRVVEGINDSTVIVVFGLGTGHLPLALRRLSRAPIVVYEPHAALLRTVLESGPLDLEDVDIVSNLHDLSNTWGKYSGRRRDCVIVNTPGYSSAFRQESEVVSPAIQRLVERVTITKNTYRKRARTWVSDVLDNVELLTNHTSFLALEGAFQGVPAFIVGAGPSLDKNVHQLTRARQKGIVFAANSSAVALARHGIQPHVVCCLESIDVSEKLQTLPFMNDVVRAFSLSAHPRTLRTGSGPLLTFYEALPQYHGPLESLTGVSGVTVCGSVSTAAFSLAQRLGCSPIVLVGQDMAFTDGKTYAAGTGFESSVARANLTTQRVELDWNEELQRQHGTDHGPRHDSEPLMLVGGWGGGEVMSGPSLMAINSWLESTATLAEALGMSRRFVNATEGGSSVKGFEELPLASLLDTLPDRELSVATIVARAHENLPPLTTHSIGAWLELQATLTKTVRVHARRVRRLSNYALAALRTDQPATINRAFARLDAEEKDLKRHVAQAPLVDAWSHADVDALVVAHGNDSGQDARSSAESAIRVGIQIAAAIEQAAKELEIRLRSNSLPLCTGTATKGNSK